MKTEKWIWNEYVIVKYVIQIDCQIQCSIVRWWLRRYWSNSNYIIYLIVTVLLPSYNMFKVSNIIGSILMHEYQCQLQWYQYKDTLDKTMFYLNEDALKNVDNVEVLSQSLRRFHEEVVVPMYGLMCYVHHCNYKNCSSLEWL